MKPQYPVYVISKGRHDCCLTADVLVKDKTPFRIVIEPQEKDLYAAKYGEELLLVLPFSNLGLGSIPARNWVWEHSMKAGHKRHWILDDNIHSLQRRWKAKRFYCNASIALKATEDFVDRYENVAIGGLNYAMFAPDRQKAPPFVLNAHVYSCLLILNELPHRWRGRYNEDTDLCLQVLSDKWCIVQLNAFLIQKIATGVMKGGNATSLYKGDGRLKMSRSLERMWPNVVTTGRRFQRPQHVVRDAWRKFDTPLIRRKDIDFDNLKENEYGMILKTIKPVKSKRLQKLVKQFGNTEK
tara:strand:- start:212 stop:1102 length:891 start_codon:yes stop_codon:yes gene_type:complete